MSPDWGAQLIRMLFQYTKVMVLISGKTRTGSNQ